MSADLVFICSFVCTLTLKQNQKYKQNNLFYHLHLCLKMTPVLAIPHLPLGNVHTVT